MSKLSEPLKALINAAHAKPNTIPASRQIAAVYDRFAFDAKEKNVGLPAWLTASTAVTMTMNSPESLLELYEVANSSQHRKGPSHGVYTAELMREVGLKCIGLNGVPRTINCLGAFYGGLPEDIRTALSERQPRRQMNRQTVDERLSTGNGLWDSIYHPLTDKLTAKLAQSHPDLPVFIIESEYGCLFGDPSSPPMNPEVRPNVGRVLMSILAIAVLRAQTGVGPQVVSHVFGLRKAFTDGTAKSDPVEGGEWLASNDGGLWLLKQVDRIVTAIGGDGGTTFAPGFSASPKAKL